MRSFGAGSIVIIVGYGIYEGTKNVIQLPITIPKHFYHKRQEKKRILNRTMEPSSTVKNARSVI